jgi:hypothetical protein
VQGEYGITKETEVHYWECGEYRHMYSQLIVFMDNVLNTAQIPFEIRQNRRGKTAVRIPLADKTWRSLAGFYSRRELCKLMGLYFPGRAYSADLQLFFDCFLEFELFKRCVFVNPDLPVGYQQLIEGEAYNAFIAYLRREAVVRNVRKKVIDWRDGLKAQAASIRDYIAALSEAYRTLLIVRVDLYYAERAWDLGDALQRMDWELDETGGWVQVPSRLPSPYNVPLWETAGRIDTAVAMRDRDRFFDNQRGADKALFEHMVGHLTKMETGGQRRSNHFHCFLFFDGSKLKTRDVDELVNGVRNRWHRTTNGLGMVYDSRNRIDRARLKAEGRWAIDPLERGDAVGLARLQGYAAGYAAKDDGQMVRIKPASKARTLTKGRFPGAAARVQCR